MQASRLACNARDRALAHRLKLAREMTRIAADRVWREAGIPPRLLDMYERGAIPVRPAHLEALAHCLDVPLAWLGSEDGPAMAETLALLGPVVEPAA